MFLKRSGSWEKVSYLNARSLRLAGLVYSSCKKEPCLLSATVLQGVRKAGRALEMAEELGKRGICCPAFRL